MVQYRGKEENKMYYGYEELKEKAVKFDSTTEDRLQLFAWFERYGGRYWNGEGYSLDEGFCLYPVYKEIANDCWEVVDVEIR